MLHSAMLHARSSAPRARTARTAQAIRDEAVLGSLAVAISVNSCRASGRGALAAASESSGAGWNCKAGNLGLGTRNRLLGSRINSGRHGTQAGSPGIAGFVVLGVLV